jgi:hypothetical protein
MVLAIAVMLCSCRDHTDETSPSQNVTPSTTIRNSLLASPFARPQSVTDEPAPQQRPLPAGDIENIETVRHAKQLAQLSKLPHLSGMAPDELLKLQQELRKKSLSQRPALLKNYPLLAGQPTQQKELLLDQLAKIVPNETSPVLLSCKCKSGPKREMCVKEECGETSALSSVCEAICGTLNVSSTSCMPASQCAGK